ncbi:MAG: HDOD domain-containing protein [Verrucomicrobia bacterium]|nr:HDOD domain-containing protein [Verrucomicrobiota bacterium]
MDDDTDWLELLQLVLGELRSRWNMKFAASGARALELMEKTSFDVVISDLNMPEMNGIELLKRARDLYPATARMLFCGSPSPGSLLEWVGLIHQFLPKPSSLEQIRSTVQRAAIARSYFSGTALQEKISRLESLPSLPSLYAELVQQLKSEEASPKDVARTISRDLGMTTRVLSTVNSAWFGLPEPMSNLADAVTILGFETLKDLVLASGVFRQFESRKLGGISLETLWHHSGRVAQAAQLIARHERAGRQVIDAAYTAGLLHDVGKLILASSYPGEYEEVVHNAQAQRLESLVAEREILNCDHAEVGGYLLDLWGLPPAVVEAVAYHHLPTRCTRKPFSALAAVHAAEVLVHAHRVPYRGVAAPHADLLFLSSIGHGNALDHWSGLLATAS